MKITKKLLSSKKPKKQRLFRYKAPLHLRGRLLNAHLSDELSKKYNKRTLRVRTGDKVKVMKGQFKGKTGKVEKVDTKNVKLFISGVEIIKKDGSKAKYPISPSNVMIIELNLDDKLRLKKLKGN